MRELGDELRRLDERVSAFDARIEEVVRRMPACRRLMKIPGIGSMTATALVAAVGDASEFRNGREMAACLGLVPHQRSTGGRPTRSERPRDGPLADNRGAVQGVADLNDLVERLQIWRGACLSLPGRRGGADCGKGVVTGGKIGLRANGGKDRDKKIARAALVTAW